MQVPLMISLDMRLHNLHKPPFHVHVQLQVDGSNVEIRKMLGLPNHPLLIFDITLKS